MLSSKTTRHGTNLLLSIPWLVLIVVSRGGLSAEPQFVPEKLMVHVRSLASPELRGRQAGTADERRAAEYVAAELDAAGLARVGELPRIDEFPLVLGDGRVAGTTVNVLGWIEGSDQPLRDRIVVLGAHLDHLGERNARLYLGADDNASGVAVVLEVAAALQKQQAQLGRSVLVALFGSEEIGLIGSRRFVSQPTVDVQRIVAMVNVDMIGRPLMDQAAMAIPKRLMRIDSDNSVAILGVRGRPLFARIVDEVGRQSQMTVLGTQPLLASITESLARNRSDHAPFEAVGIPTLFFSSGESDDYHRPEDTVEKLKPTLMARRAGMIYETVKRLTKAPAEELPRIQNAVPPSGQPVTTLALSAGDLQLHVRDNAASPRELSGLDSLFHRSSPGFDAFDPDGKGASSGLNFEHIISGHAHPQGKNSFAPRHGRFSLYRVDDGQSALLVRRREDCPWDVSSTLSYRPVGPHAIDFTFRCTPHDATRFAPQGNAIFFFANYMNDVESPAIHFLGTEEAGGQEKWITADAPPGHPDWNQGGTYRAHTAEPLIYDAGHDFRLNSWSYDSPRFTRPFYYGRAQQGMVFMLMFDRAHTPDDEIRFSLFKFKLPKKPRPAWDFQYVIHQVVEHREYGFRGRLVWKKWVSAEDCLAEYNQWQAKLAP